MHEMQRQRSGTAAGNRPPQWAAAFASMHCLRPAHLPEALPEGASLGGAWHPDSPKPSGRFVSLGRIGVPGILTGSATKNRGATKDPHR